METFVEMLASDFPVQPIVSPSRPIKELLAESATGVSGLVQDAERQGLTLEIVESYASARAQGLSIRESIEFARNEWDV